MLPGLADFEIPGRVIIAGSRIKQKERQQEAIFAKMPAQDPPKATEEEEVSIN